jgi:hypothetical protein
MGWMGRRVFGSIDELQCLWIVDHCSTHLKSKLMLILILKMRIYGLEIFCSILLFETLFVYTQTVSNTTCLLLIAFFSHFNPMNLNLSIISTH